MFTGIIRGVGKIAKLNSKPGACQYQIAMDKNLLTDLQIGASIAIDGTCLTVVSFTKHEATFDAINETLQKTNMKFLKEGDLVNIERAARFGDEIGGHILSGHIFCTAVIDSIERTENNCVIWLKCPLEWIKYLFPKGYIALNGASLTLVDVDKQSGLFSVHLIPETLEKTTFGMKKAKDAINVEIDTQTQAIVDTIERIYTSKSTS
ncbi:MAG TPA: riboflavin synthase subunit alpha [Parachlamydiaceae bacterium]|nr:riboflavin synthase subunit alpha [Parachlamydiaceae bacterium]